MPSTERHVHRGECARAGGARLLVGARDGNTERRRRARPGARRPSDVPMCVRARDKKAQHVVGAWTEPAACSTRRRHGVPQRRSVVRWQEFGGCTGPLSHSTCVKLLGRATWRCDRGLAGARDCAGAWPGGRPHHPSLALLEWQDGNGHVAHIRLDPRRQVPFHAVRSAKLSVLSLGCVDVGASPPGSGRPLSTYRINTKVLNPFSPPHLRFLVPHFLKKKSLQYLQT
jgi:hypothetical protein